jgi:hypothetical protein
MTKIIFFNIFYTSLILTLPNSALFNLLRLLEEEPTSVNAVPIVEGIVVSEGVYRYNIAGMALAGCPSAKDVAKIASQKSIDKQDVYESEEGEESSTEEEDEDEDPTAGAEKRAQREIKLLVSKIKNFK